MNIFVYFTTKARMEAGHTSNTAILEGETKTWPSKQWTFSLPCCLNFNLSWAHQLKPIILIALAACRRAICLRRWIHPKESVAFPAILLLPGCWLCPKVFVDLSFCFTFMEHKGGSLRQEQRTVNGTAPVNWMKKPLPHFGVSSNEPTLAHVILDPFVRLATWRPVKLAKGPGCSFWSWRACRWSCFGRSCPTTLCYAMAWQSSCHFDRNFHIACVWHLETCWSIQYADWFQNKSNKPCSVSRKCGPRGRIIKPTQYIYIHNLFQDLMASCITHTKQISFRPFNQNFSALRKMRPKGPHQWSRSIYLQAKGPHQWSRSIYLQARFKQDTKASCIPILTTKQIGMKLTQTKLVLCPENAAQRAAEAM